MPAFASTQVEHLSECLTYHIVLFANFTYSLYMEHFQDAKHLEDQIGTNLRELHAAFKGVCL